jgi:hypothetical protein
MDETHSFITCPKTAYSATPEKAFSSVKQSTRRILVRTIGALVECDTEVSHSNNASFLCPELAKPGDGRSQTDGGSRSDTEMPSWDKAERPALTASFRDLKAVRFDAKHLRRPLGASGLGVFAIVTAEPVGAVRGRIDWRGEIRWDTNTHKLEVV